MKGVLRKSVCPTVVASLAGREGALGALFNVC